MDGNYRRLGGLIVTAFLSSLMGCLRSDFGSFIVSLAGHVALSNSVVVLETSTGVSKPLCGSEVNKNSICIAAQGTNMRGPFVVMRLSAQDQRQSLHFIIPAANVDKTIAESVSGLLGASSLSPAGNLVAFTISSDRSPSLFNLQIWDVESGVALQAKTRCTGEGYSVAYPKFNADQSMIAFTCYRREPDRTIKTSIRTYDIANRREYDPLDGTPVVSAAYSPRDPGLLAVWTANGLEVVGPNGRKVVVGHEATSNANIPSNGITWSGDGKNIVFCLSTKERDALVYAVEVQSGKIRKVIRYKNTRIVGIDGLER